MSEQEEKSGGGSGGPVMVVDTSASQGQYKPYRPTELEAAPEPHKRSRAPAVPSVAEEFKNAAINDPETLEKIEAQQAMSTEKMSRRESSSTKRRVSSPEVIKMDLLDPAKKDLITPIPAPVETVASKEDASKLDAIKKADEDSITDEITELRTPEPGGQDRSEWPTHSKKKEISWGDSEYLDKIRLEESAKAKRCQSIFRDLNSKSQAAILERKPSIGPCIKPSLLGGRSGISICVPKKSIRTMKEEFNPTQSVIDINISKKNTSESTSHLPAPKKIPKKLEKEVLQNMSPCLLGPTSASRQDTDNQASAEKKRRNKLSHH